MKKRFIFLLALLQSSVLIQTHANEINYEKIFKEAVKLNNPKLASEKYPILAKEDIQKSKWIYIWRYFYAKDVEDYKFQGFFDGGQHHHPDEKKYRMMQPPSDYTGTWTAWNIKGEKLLQVELMNGYIIDKKTELPNDYIFYNLRDFVAEEYLPIKLTDSVVSQRSIVHIIHKNKVVHKNTSEFPSSFSDSILKIGNQNTVILKKGANPILIYQYFHGRVEDYHFCELGDQFKIIRVVKKVRLNLNTKADVKLFLNK